MVLAEWDGELIWEEGMSKRIDYKEGQKFEGTRLTFIKEVEPTCDKRGRMIRKALFECECGNEATMTISAVRAKASKTCGCSKVAEIIKAGKNNKTHGLSKTGAYKSYISMMRRCYNKKDTGYPNYGGRGIEVCERWRDKEMGAIRFVEDMGQRPAKHTLDRIDVDANYSPDNCRWADRSTQSYNRRVSKSSKTGKTGVKISSYDDEGNPVYIATIRKDNKDHHLVKTKDFELACFCRDEAELHFYGYNKTE